MIESAIVTDHAVAVYATHLQAEEAIKLLNKSGYNMKNLSIIGQNYETEDQPVGFLNAGDRMWSWGKFGAFWGSIWGVMFGSAMMFIPGYGFIFFAGWLVAALGGAVIGGGLAALGAALASIGIPEDSIVRYKSELKAGSFLLLAHGNAVEVQKAKDSLSSTNATHVDTYSAKQPVVSHSA
ncbi:MAG: hypothetical protein P4L46_19660 [Fimbriimonas sp.]|nr:hypothetical protein [Fimbriimonas sp.]